MGGVSLLPTSVSEGESAVAHIEQTVLSGKLWNVHVGHGSTSEDMSDQVQLKQRGQATRASESTSLSNGYNY